jgi:hypothetical protein
MAQTFAFIDESGNHDLNVDKGGASSYFIVLAIVVKEAGLVSLCEKTERIREMHFQLGEMKSSSVRNKDGHQRRIKILDDIRGLDFNFYAVAVDKLAVLKDGGLQYKRTFIKFVNGLLYRQLFQSFFDISIFADAHGGQEFVNGFKSYIEEHHKPDLFWRSQVEIVDSKENVLVQLADFVVGSIAKVYEGKSNASLNEAYLKLVREKALYIDEWPTKYQTYDRVEPGSTEFDPLIYSHAMVQAEAFLRINDGVDDEEKKLQCAALSFLVFVSKFDPLKDYVGTNEIVLRLQEAGFDKVTEQAIRSIVVAKLRDNNVLIASCSKGYKIPKSYRDLVDFVERVNGLVLPLLDRLKKARISFLIASQGDIDILKSPNFRRLAAFIDQLEK